MFTVPAFANDVGLSIWKLVYSVFSVNVVVHIPCYLCFKLVSLSTTRHGNGTIKL